ncbi:TetR/AcrR family transcriptional regulator [Pendulispora brunnea]|uniref:TetR/AcrR family transcriptional regulator n=1 Tax=Pendulispora brunnea TaxID=2905690 RepID=A0ABZ2KKF9_9BACT
MRYPPAETAEKHQRILDEASKLFRERGFSGVSVSELMEATGLTHGPFYNHFASKQALMEACIQHIAAKAIAELEAVPSSERGKAEFFAAYLSTEHRDAPGAGCLSASLGPECSREAGLRQAFTEYVRNIISTSARHLPWKGKRSARSQAIHSMAAMVGAIVLARGVSDDELSEEILNEVRRSLE